MIRPRSLPDTSTYPIMFDDITDEEYAEWKDWFDAGSHDLLAGIVLIVISLFAGAAVLQEVESDDMAIKPAIWESGTTPDIIHGCPRDTSFDFDDDFDDTSTLSVAENFDRCKTK